MTGRDEEYLVGLAAQIAVEVVARLKDEGLAHDDRPLLTLEEARLRLNVSERKMSDLTLGVDGKPPAIQTTKVFEGHKGVRVEPRELDRFIEEQRRVVAAGRDGV